MAKRAYNKIMAGLQDAIAHSKGEHHRGKTHIIPVMDVKEVRHKLNLSQHQFATTFGIPASTIKNWEQGHRMPEGAARILLAVIDRDPALVKRVLKDLQPA